MVSLNDSCCSSSLGRKLKRGDTREDGYRFNKYRYVKNTDGTKSAFEVWLSPESWERELKNAAIRCREYRLKNKDNPEYLARKKASNERCRNTESAKIKQSVYQKNYYKNPVNVERRRKYKRKYIDHKINSLNRLKHNISTLIAFSIRKKGFSKNTKTEKILGCSWSFFKAYIEARFQEGMSFENKGKWHIDHIVPVSSGKTERDVIKLNHYTNLRPMWASDNIKKSNKMPIEQLHLIKS